MNMFGKKQTERKGVKFWLLSVNKKTNINVFVMNFLFGGQLWYSKTKRNNRPIECFYVYRSHQRWDGECDRTTVSIVLHRQMYHVPYFFFKKKEMPGTDIPPFLIKVRL